MRSNFNALFRQEEGVFYLIACPDRCPRVDGFQVKASRFNPGLGKSLLDIFQEPGDGGVFLGESDHAGTRAGEGCGRAQLLGRLNRLGSAGEQQQAVGLVQPVVHGSIQQG